MAIYNAVNTNFVLALNPLKFEIKISLHMSLIELSRS